MSKKDSVCVCACVCVCVCVRASYQDGIEVNAEIIIVTTKGKAFHWVLWSYTAFVCFFPFPFL